LGKGSSSNSEEEEKGLIKCDSLGEDDKDDFER
jgi:hypothetical protein